LDNAAVSLLESRFDITSHLRLSAVPDPNRTSPAGRTPLSITEQTAGATDGYAHRRRC